MKKNMGISGKERHHIRRLKQPLSEKATFLLKSEWWKVASYKKSRGGFLNRGNGKQVLWQEIKQMVSLNFIVKYHVPEDDEEGPFYIQVIVFFCHKHHITDILKTFSLKAVSEQ